MTYRPYNRPAPKLSWKEQVALREEKEMQRAVKKVQMEIALKKMKYVIMDKQRYEKIKRQKQRAEMFNSVLLSDNLRK